LSGFGASSATLTTQEPAARIAAVITEKTTIRATASFDRFLLPRR